jgi:hypothetical protein
MRERSTGHGAGGTGTAVEYLSPGRAVRLHGRSSLSSAGPPARGPVT